jgi:hypothetical protein
MSLVPRSRAAVLAQLAILLAATTVLPTLVLSPASAATTTVLRRPQQVSACVGMPGKPVGARLIWHHKETRGITFDTWTECFTAGGGLDSITSHLALQKYEREGRHGSWHWVTIYGPYAKHFPPVTSHKFYQHDWVTCAMVDYKGKYRTKADATWVDDGQTGETNWGYSASAELC